MFKNLTATEICRRMSAICQKCADESFPGDDQERLQGASDKFRDEADTLALDDLQHSFDWHIECPGPVDKKVPSLVRRMETSGLKLVGVPRNRPTFN